MSDRITPEHTSIVRPGSVWTTPYRTVEAFNAARLQQLRAEFEAALEQWQRNVRGNSENHLVWNAKRLVEIDGRYINLLGPLTPDDVALISGLATGAPGSVGLAARRYIIAHDFNEFDPKRADMLWKLQKQ